MSVADSCRQLLSQNPHAPDSVRLVWQSKVAFNQVDADSAIYHSNQLIQEATQLKNPHFIAQGYYLKSLGLLDQSKPEDALKCLMTCIEEAEKTQNTKLIAMACQQSGNIYSTIENFAASIPCYHKAIALFKAQKLDIPLAGCYMNLAGDYSSTLRTDSAYLLYELADSIYLKNQKPVQAAYAQGSRGMLLVKNNQAKVAIPLLYTSVQLLLKEKHYPAAITFMLAHSEAKQQLNQTKEALQIALQSLELAQKECYKIKIRDAYEQLSTLYAAMHNYAKAYETQNAYYTYRDSLVNAETITKMANLRTEFEVGQKQKEVEVLQQKEQFQGRLNRVLLFGSAGLVVFLVILYRNFMLSRKISRITQKQNEELAKINASKDQLFSVISHDLRSPIGALGNLVLLAQDALKHKEYEELAHLFRLMDQSNTDIDTLLNQLLNWSIGQRNLYNPNPTLIDFKELMQLVANPFQLAAAAKGISLTLETGHFAQPVYTDVNSWSVILRNLIGNALKFTHTGGFVRVTLTDCTESIEVEVADSGIGMDESKIRDIQQMPVQESNWGTHREKGVGIGLSLVKDFVRIHRGSFQVKSKLQEGSTFTVCIPVTNDTPADFAYHQPSGSAN